MEEALQLVRLLAWSSEGAVLTAIEPIATITIGISGNKEGLLRTRYHG